MKDTAQIPVADTAVADTLAAPDPAAMHIIMERPAPAPIRGTETSAGTTMLSWILLVMLSIFVLVALKFHGNLRFTSVMVKELVSGSERRNMFDDTDTMHETSFVMLLNLLSIASCGILLWCVALGGAALTPGAAHALWVCMAASAALYMVQRTAYFCIGRIFYTAPLTNRWLKSFSASQGLLSLLLFPLSLLAIFYPAGVTEIATAAFSAWILARLMFIIKGFRIFSSSGGNFFTFLYYLCSVEIIPALLTCTTAFALCRA